MILITGGSGILGTKLDHLLTENGNELFCPGKCDLNINDPFGTYSMKGIKLIVHCAAFTNLVLAEKEKELCYQTNVIGTRNLAKLGIPMLYISTEYVFDGEKGNYNEEAYPNPVNFYALTKLLGEYESRHTRSVVIRCLFKPNPFKHLFACADQFTTGDYVERIAPEIAHAIKIFDKLPPTIHIGFEKKSTFELARKTREVKPIKVEDVKEVKLPKDTSLDTSLWRSIRGNPIC